jgi:hypothetical protein
MAAHSACAISGGVVTVGHAPPVRAAADGPAPPARGSRRGAALARAGPRPWPRPPWPASPGLAGHASPGTRRHAHLAGRAPRRTSAFAHACKRATGHISSRYQLHMITAPAAQMIVLQAWTCISLGVRRKVQIGHCQGIRGCPGIPVSAGIQNGIRISWRKGTPAGSRVAPGLVTAPAKGHGPGRGSELHARCAGQ